MKKVELEKMIADAISFSPVVSENNLDGTEVHKLAKCIVDRIKDALIVKKVLVVSGSIDDCPDYSIHHIDEDISELVNRAEEDNDGFNKDDLETTLEFNLIED